MYLDASVHQPECSSTSPYQGEVPQAVRFLPPQRTNHLGNLLNHRIQMLVYLLIRKAKKLNAQSRDRNTDHRPKNHLDAGHRGAASSYGF